MIIGSITITSLDPIGNAVAGDTLIPVVNMDGVPTTQKMTVANLMQVGIGANLGPVANVIITGGTNGYVLQTDGTGNLSWTAQTGGSGNGSVGGANTQVQFNDSGDFGGNSGFTFDKVSGSLSSPVIDTEAVYHLAGVVIENADLTHGATSALIIPGNGNTSVPTQLTNTYGNIVVTAGVDPDHLKSWNFDKTGNLNLPGNTFAINYANGTAVPLDSYGNSNVATFLAAYGSNTITTTGNVSVGNIIGNGQALTGIAGANVIGAVAYATTANSVAVANVSGIGNIATVALNGNGSQVLLGNGTWGNAGISSVSELVSGGNSFVLDADGSVTFQGADPGQGVNRGLVWDYGANANGVNSVIRQDGNGITVRAWTEQGGGANGYSAPVRIVTNQNATEKVWNFDGSGNLTLPGNLNIPTGNIVSNIIAPAFNLGITGINSTGNANVTITIAGEVFDGPVSGQVTISNVNAPAQANGDWWYQASDFDQFQLYTDSSLTTPVDGSGWPGYAGPGGDAVGIGTYGNLTVQGGNVSINSNDKTWTFGNTGQLSTPDGTFIGNIEGANTFGFYNANATSFLIEGPNNITWSFNTGTGNLAVPGPITSSGDISIVSGLNQNFYARASDNQSDGWSIYNIVDDGAGNNLTQTRLEYNQFSVRTNLQGNSYTWQFDDTGTLRMPGNISGTYGGNMFVSIGDQPGSDTFIDLRTISYIGDTLISNIRIGNPNVTISTGNAAYSWTFDGNGTLTVPNEGLIQSLNDTIILRSKDTGTGNRYDVRLGTNGGLYFETTEYSQGWLNIVNNAGNANINAIPGTGGAGGKSIYINGGAADQTDFYTTSGGNVNLIGGLGASNDGGGGGPGGSINLTAGNSADTAGVAGNVTINTGTNTWKFANTGNLTLPTISLGGGIDEQAVVSSQRKLIPPFRYSAVIDANNPTVVYNATNVDTTSMKVTMQIQHAGLGMEFFEVFATFTGADTYFTVGNRVSPSTIAPSTVVVGLGVGNAMKITVTINSGATTSWVTYDAVEFGIAVD